MNMLNIFTDFDNTITTVDTTDAILAEFADTSWWQIEEQLVQKAISAKTCMQQQIRLLKTTPEKLKEFILDTITIRDGFREFVNFCKKHNYPCTILSDGLDFVINLVLNKYKISNVPFYSNHLVFHKGKFDLKFPNWNDDCLYKMGTCKCEVVRQHSTCTKKIVYIGDGSSDYCVALNVADHIFARDSLAKLCRDEQRKYLDFKDFKCIIKHVSYI